MCDNATLMFLKILIKSEFCRVFVAGLDGFSSIQTENYISNDLINNARENELDERNLIMSQELQNLSANIEINFITKTRYKYENQKGI